MHWFICMFSLRFIFILLCSLKCQSCILVVRCTSPSRLNYCTGQVALLTPTSSVHPDLIKTPPITSDTSASGASTTGSSAAVSAAALARLNEFQTDSKDNDKYTSIKMPRVASFGELNIKSASPTSFLAAEIAAAPVMREESYKATTPVAKTVAATVDGRGVRDGTVERSNLPQLGMPLTATSAALDPSYSHRSNLTFQDEGDGSDRFKSNGRNSRTDIHMDTMSGIVAHTPPPPDILPASPAVCDQIASADPTTSRSPRSLHQQQGSREPSSAPQSSLAAAGRVSATSIAATPTKSTGSAVGPIVADGTHSTPTAGNGSGVPSNGVPSSAVRERLLRQVAAASASVGASTGASAAASAIARVTLVMPVAW